MAVIGFHGQGGSGARLFSDAGRPAWLDWCPDWQDLWGNSPKEFASLIADQGVQFVAVGYSLGGDFIAQLTYYAADYLRGILVYESPLLSVTRPNRLPIPCMVIWNDYRPLTRKRREGKWYSISRWTQAYPHAEQIFGKLKGHVTFKMRRPWIHHAWDTSLNGIIANWIKGC